MKTKILHAVIASLLLFITAPVQAATVTYEYVGINFDAFIGSIYDTTNKVTATITMSAPIGANQTGVSPALLSWTLNDGQAVITDATATFSSFVFSTNAFGDITYWDFYAEEKTPTPTEGSLGHSIESDHNATFISEGGIGWYYTGGVWTQPVSGGYFDQPPDVIGTWTVTAVPIPPAAWLFGSGLLGMIGIARRKVIT